MQSIYRYILLLILPLLSSCILLGYSKVPFVSSSLDYNEGRPQEYLIKATKLETSISRFISLAKERDYFITAKNCQEDFCNLEFKYGKDLNRQLTFGSGGGGTYNGYGSSSMSVNTVSLDKGSRLYVKFTKSKEGVLISAFGLPVLNQENSCPEYFSKNVAACTAPSLMARWGDLTDSVRSQWGFDISGKTEFEVISGIFAEI